jgi:AcrR family transcriptional regulator
MNAVTDTHDTRTRLLDTALELFSEHGMEGTSLQMIADALGVTKAAVYYHFKTKDEIVAAIVGPPLRELDQALDEALAKRSRSAQIDRALQGFVDLVVRHRALFSLVNSDPGIQRVVKRTSEAARLEDITTKMQRVCAGAAPNLAEAITAHIVFAGLPMVAGYPAYADVDDETLRQHLLDVGRRLLGRPRR